MRSRVVAVLVSASLVLFAAPVATAAPDPSGANFVRFGPTRLLDTRHARPVPANGTFVLRIAGAGGVPADATALTLTVTAADERGPGYVSVFPHGMAQPGTSTLNFTAAGPISGSTIVPPGNDGEIDLFVHGAATDLIVDITGYFEVTPTGGDLLPGTRRDVDTRTGLGTNPTGQIGSSGPAGAIPPGGTLELPLSNDGAVRFGNLAAAILTVTVTQPAANGYLTVYPDDEARPGTSTVNFVRGQTVSNMVISGTGMNGVKIYNGSSGSVQMIVDVEGEWSPVGGDSYVTLPQYRALRSGPIAAGASVREPFTQPAAGMPGVDAIVMTTTATATTGHGYLTVGAGNGTSDVNWTEGQTIADLTVPQVDSDPATLPVHNASSGSVQVLGDILGYFTVPPQQTN